MALASLVLIYFYLVVAPYLFITTIAGHRVSIDLSHELNSKTMHWLSDRSFDIKIRNGTRQFGNLSTWYQTDEISLTTHTGTHLDAPKHFYQAGYSVSEIPLSRLIEKQLIIIDITEQSQAQKDYSATIKDILEFEKLNGEIPEDSVVAFLTGWSRHWPNKLAYFGTESTDNDQVHFPGISASAAEFLANKRHVAGVGIDGPGIDCGKCGSNWAFRAHVKLAEANIYAIENLDTNLFRIPPVGATITVLPLKITGASGSPARVIAQFSHHHHDTNNSNILVPFWTFLIVTFTSLFKL